jgi:hypothetical protein
MLTIGKRVWQTPGWLERVLPQAPAPAATAEARG